MDNFTNNKAPVQNGLLGTKTENGLREAFLREAENAVRGRIFAAEAKRYGSDLQAKKLLEIADNDERLAELWLSYLDGIGDTVENFSALAASKLGQHTDIYPALAADASEEGFYEIAEKLRLAALAKKSQSEDLSDGPADSADPSDPADPIDPDFSYPHDEAAVWRCPMCGYKITGNMCPELCPLCSMLFSKEKQAISGKGRDCPTANT